MASGPSNFGFLLSYNYERVGKNNFGKNPKQTPERPQKCCTLNIALLFFPFFFLFPFFLFPLLFKKEGYFFFPL